MKIKLRQLSHALALWRCGSFRRAAADQHLSQPALSRSIHALEESLGVPLFDRDATDVTLTKYGETFLQRAETIVMEASELEREMSLMKGLGIGRFSLAMGVYSAGMSGNSAVAELMRNHPGLQIRLELRHWRDVERMVRSRQVDIGFAELAHLRDAPGICTETVGCHEVLFFCREGHPVLERVGELSPAVLDEYPFAGVPIPLRLAPLFPRNRNVDEATGDVFPPILVEDLAATCAIVARTDAIAAASALQLDPWLKRGGITVVPLRAPWATLEYGFIHLESRSLPPAAEEFMNVVRSLEPEIERGNRILTERWFQGLRPRLRA
jgi:DNA-binding transcriptional LysR family regulator